MKEQPYPKSACRSQQGSEILAVLPNFNGGGAERVSLHLANELSRRGKSVHLSVFNRSGHLGELVAQDIQVHDFRKDRLRRAVLPLLKLVHDLRPAVVFSTLGYVNLALLLLKPLFPAKTRIWVREANLPSISLAANKHHSMMQLGYSILYPRADLLICSSHRMREEFAKDYGIPEARMRVLANPVDETSIRMSAGIPNRISGNGVRFVASGRLTGQKGFDLLLEMFAKLGDDMAGLTILGDGPLDSDLRSQAHRLGVSNRVHFLGFRKNPWPYYAGADAFLLSSRWEGMPNAALEALACGVPVIATPESGGIAEVAAETAPGAVTVAEFGQPFIEAMRQVGQSNRLSLHSSLLPPRYRLESVIDTFEKWLEENG